MRTRAIINYGSSRGDRIWLLASVGGRRQFNRFWRECRTQALHGPQKYRWCYFRTTRLAVVDIDDADYRYIKRWHLVDGCWYPLAAVESCLRLDFVD